MSTVLKWILRVLGVLLGVIVLLLVVAALTPVPTDAAVAPADYGAGASSVLPSYSGLLREFPAANTPTDNATTAEKVELGRLLFFDPVLSVNNDIACATCHHPDLGFSDGQAAPTGASGKPLPRSAPTLWNAVYQQALFWDGRAASLEEQAQIAITHADEMGSDAAAVAAELQAIPTYVEMFDQAFGGGTAAVTLDNAVKAIAAFERTLISNSSPFDQYAAGNFDSLTPPQRRGLNLFRSAATRCFECHAAPTFSNGTFRVIGVPDDDPGRAGVASDAPQGAFKVPTLRNIALTAPYMHDGSLATLEEVVDFYADGGGWAHGMSDVDQFVLGFELSDQEKADLIAFLYALTDEQARPPIPAAVPSGLPVVQPVENLERAVVASVNAVSAAGESLRPDRAPTTIRVEPGETIQDAVDRARAGDTVLVPYGVYHERVVVDVSDFTLLGEPNEAGEWPVLDGLGEMADGVIASGNNFEMAYFTVRHYKSNGVLVEGATGVHLHHLYVEDTGTYGIYPTLSTDVVVEYSTAVGMHDAGIYAGKCANVIVRHNVAYGNVLGIEVENTDTAEIYDNHAYDNATGIFVDLLPNLPSKVSLNTKVYDNLVENNNHVNFAPPEITAALVPEGAGIVLLGADHVEVYNNTVRGNNSAGIAIFNLTVAFDPQTIDVGPTPENNWVHSNILENNGSDPDDMVADLGIPGADILWDVSGVGNVFDQPEASKFPPLMPTSQWPTPLYRIYWHGLNLALKLLG
ncbi:MAG: hypothetical protein Fur0021_21310 [Candidatus Promineifilaceae bacterium]